MELGFTSTVGILHDGNGQLQPLGQRETGNFRRDHVARQEFVHAGERVPAQYRRGPRKRWRCRAGSRYLYICEDGLVHYCSQQRGYPGIPLAEYTAERRQREFLTKKGCAPKCTVSCVTRFRLSIRGARRRRSTAGRLRSPARSCN